MQKLKNTKNNMVLKWVVVKHDTWNNEADAFKHAFMQADLALKTTVGLSKIAGDRHEKER